MTTATDVPLWFRDAVATCPDRSSLTVDGARVAYRTWGDPGSPGLLLVHGGAAHAGWWDHIAPRYARDRRVVALDLSGHGDSEWRNTYSFRTWADEIAAVARAAGAERDAVLVGHSLGGLAGIEASRRHPDLVGDLMLIDSRLIDAENLDRIRADAAENGIPRASRHYPTIDAAIQRYRLVPDHPSLDYVRAHVARQSVVEDDHGWRWKFDRGFADDLLDLPPMPPSTCRLTVVHGERGVMTAEMARRVSAGLESPARIVELPGAGHHIPLEKPLELMDVIDDALTYRPGPIRSGHPDPDRD
ncbi:alpha/beta fold hydrolase [Gordonia sp. NPDC058843]|uniref:alpha/beta fold hydrolase n=1 Tax=Gordonia sp. NPDC058843 TaxID=3346648 RepID=UPI00369A3976